MSDWRIAEHPILTAPERTPVRFTWCGRELEGYLGEPVSSALFAAGVRVFGNHPHDGAPQGIFCANGQCSQCTVLAFGAPVKACMTPLVAGMELLPLEGKPALPLRPPSAERHPIETSEVECLVLGGGPAGLSAAIELGRNGVRTIVVDDKHRLGGKLVLQTHKFFGSIEDCHAGTRGIDIARNLAAEVEQFEVVQVWLNTTALALFADRKVGLLRENHYVVVRPEALLVATGARERALLFRGNTLPGVYGAGAFQTLVNRDMVRPSKRLFVIGGGNVGLIAAYHALQAGIQVVGLCEAEPECGGYQVHRDKLARMGVPIHTSHTILSANGSESVESVTIARLGPDRLPVAGSERTFPADTILIAVGLTPVDEFLWKAREFNLPVAAAGDAEEIAEASAAMFMGRIRGIEIARQLGREVGPPPPEWHRTAEILKSRPGAAIGEELEAIERSIFPVFHCGQEIPCNPCTTICPEQCIVIEGGDLRGLPEYTGEGCIGCERCVALCPGLAITLVDLRPSGTHAVVTLPFELPREKIREGEVVTVLDIGGAILGNVEVLRVRAPKFADHALLVRLSVPRELALSVAGIRKAEETAMEKLDQCLEPVADDEIVCRCERVPAGAVRDLIRDGVRDFNEIKAVTRAGMGACQGKTCAPLLRRLFREMGVDEREVTESTRRPLVIEVPLGAFAGIATGRGPVRDTPVRHATDPHEGGL